MYKRQELMQYNVRPDALAEFLEKEPLGEGLRLKMKDVLTMYQGFTEYLKGRYITAEEVLELLYDVAEESELLRNSVIVLDEFTGFTPIQNRLKMCIRDRVLVCPVPEGCSDRIMDRTEGSTGCDAKRIKGDYPGRK